MQHTELNLRLVLDGRVDLALLRGELEQAKLDRPLRKLENWFAIDFGVLLAPEQVRADHNLKPPGRLVGPAVAKNTPVPVITKRVSLLHGTSCPS